MDFLQTLMGSFLAVAGAGGLIAYTLKKAIETKISTDFAILLEDARRELARKDELRQRKLEAYQKYLSLAYRCRNYITEFTVGDRRNRLFRVAEGSVASRDDAIEYQEAYRAFLENVRQLENVLYEDRIYLHVDAFTYLHVFKGQVVAFRKRLERAVDQMKRIGNNSKEYKEMSSEMHGLAEIARGLDSGFRDLDITMKKELFTDEPVYWDKLPLSCRFTDDPMAHEEDDGIP